MRKNLADLRGQLVVWKGWETNSEMLLYLKVGTGNLERMDIVKSNVLGNYLDAHIESS